MKELRKEPGGQDYFYPPSLPQTEHEMTVVWNAPRIITIQQAADEGWFLPFFKIYIYIFIKTEAMSS